MRVPRCNLYPDAPTFMLNGPTESESRVFKKGRQKGWCAMKRQHTVRLGVSLAVLLAGLLVFADPASGGVSFRLSVGGRSGSHRGHSSYRSYHGSRYHGSRYHRSGYHRSSYRSPYRGYRSVGYYRSPVVSRSYSTTYYGASGYGSYSTTTLPYDSYRSTSVCGSCGGSTCRCGSRSSSYYTAPVTTYRTYTRYSSGRCGSGTVVRYIIVH